MTETASATVAASSGSRDILRAPGGLPYLTSGWSAMGRPWNSATGIDSASMVEFPNLLGNRLRSRLGSKSFVVKGCVSLSFFSVVVSVLGGSKPYSAKRLNMQPVPTYIGP